MEKIGQSWSNPLDDEALFRFLIISMINNLEALGELRSHAVSQLSNTQHIDHKGKTRRISVRSIYRWMKAYEHLGNEGLRSVPRQRIDASRVITPDQLAFFKEQKKEDPKASIPELIKRARLTGLIKAGESISRTSLWRALKRQGVSTRRGRTHKTVEGNRFAYMHRMDMILCDGKHFRAGSSRLKRVVLCFIDDATRKILGMVVGTAESAQLFLRGLHRVIQEAGLMQRLYTDHGSGFIAKDSARVAASLNICLIHGKVAYPQARGKIERFNQTLWNDLLRRFDGNPDINPDCSSLECRLTHYIQEMYNKAPHESLAGRTPHSCFSDDSRPLRFPDNDEALNNHFMIHERRTVSNDCVIQVGGRKLETPQGMARDRIEIFRHVLTGEVFMLHDQRVIQLQSVDLHANAKTIRPSTEQEPPSRSQVLTAAEMAFERDHASLVDSQGNYLMKGENL